VCYILFQLPSVSVNCIECYSSRYLYEHILNNLPSLASKTREGAAVSNAPITCDNMNDFIRNLKQEVEKRKLQNETLYIVSSWSYIVHGFELKNFEGLSRSCDT
jgi:origin recognition complex subunit 5